MDVTQLDSIHALVQAVVRDFGRIDVLVNNAGYEQIQPFTEVTPEAYDHIMAVNMKGVFFMAQEVAKVMKEHGAARSSTSAPWAATSVWRSPACTAPPRAG